MSSVLSGELPREALLNSYRQQDAYTDCYFIDLPLAVSHAEYVEAFYTTIPFRLERLILAVFVLRPSTRLQARELANNEINRFAAWSVEDRATNQLLLCDFMGRTRSWLMSVPGKGNPGSTRLYFGSAFVPATDRASGEKRFGFVFHAMLGFHRLYSRILLRSAFSRLMSSGRDRVR